MLRQKPESYDQDKDSPLIGGYGTRENINFAAEPEVGWGPYVRTAELITLLEQAAKEFPEQGAYIGTAFYIDAIEKWKLKWLTVPPV